jgi:cellulose synthase operon protein C
MLKVECDSCKAPYQVDERRVPPAGLKMRCPKCGQSFLVTNPGAAGAPPKAPPPAAAARPPAARPPPPARPPVAPPPPAARPPAGPPVRAASPNEMFGVSPSEPPTAPTRSSFPSDFPAALGFLQEGDLPVVSPDLPAAKSPSPRTNSVAPPKGGLGQPRAGAPLSPSPYGDDNSPFGDAVLALPDRAADLPSAKGRAARGPNASPFATPPFDVNLPASAVQLPGGSPGLPALAAPLPARTGTEAFLPSPLSSLPVTAHVLPQVAKQRTFGEIDLPVAADSLPAIVAREQQLPVVVQEQEPTLGGAFGEIDLPREAPSSAPPRRTPADDSSNYEDLRLGKPRRSPPPASPSRAYEDTGREGGMTFGEVDLGGDSHTARSSSIRVDGLSHAPAGAAADSAWSPVTEAAPAAVPPAAARWPVAARGPAVRRKPSIARALVVALVVALLLGGASLQLTPYGAFGYLFASDILHAGSYATATDAAIAQTQKALGADTYDVAKAAVESAYAAHARTPRAKPLTAYAALVDSEATVRYGVDPSRASRAKQLVAELALGGKVSYLDLALAAQAAEGLDLDKARSALEAESQGDRGDLIALDVARLLGDVDLARQDGPAAVIAFKRAASLSDDARAHFGLARAYDLLGDAVNTKKEIDATLAASPQHPGALTLRARRKSAPSDPLQALSDLAIVLDGPARAKASENELSDAYAAKAWVDLERGATGDARESFAQAVKLNPGNVDALNGEGRLFLDEGRYAEALARFDTALKAASSSPETIANDADAKLALERLEDAKQQLTAARDRFPKSVPILLVLGKVEQRLGNGDAAEADLRAAIADADPMRPGAVLPYVALSELLSARGHLSDARTVLDLASKSLPPSAALERAFGEVSELQGDYDVAITHYRAAVATAPKDLAAHFRLAVALRRVRRFDAASEELDHVGAVDQDYPGLLLERGLLFEESGDVNKAIEQFKVALARAPDDPDLELRVGSAYVAIDRPDDALPMLRKVLDKRPTSAEAHHYIGRALMEKGGSSQADALHYLQRAVEIDPNRAEFHVFVARAANDATPAQLELARDEVDRALTLDKLNPEAYWQRGVIERVEGAIDDAMKDERHALELRPSRYEAHATLAECYEDKNDEASALTEWARAIAGDGTATGPEGEILHPYWRYRYGKLLIEKSGKPAALAQLLPAVETAEKMELRPAWLAPLEFLAAEALRGVGRKVDAIEHYRRFLEIAPVSSPDRADARAALTAMLPREAPQ